MGWCMEKVCRTQRTNIKYLFKYLNQKPFPSHPTPTPLIYPHIPHSRHSNGINNCGLTIQTSSRYNINKSTMASTPPLSPSPDPSKPASPRVANRGLGLASRQGSRSSRNNNDNGSKGAATTPIPDEDYSADLPLTMSASIVLTGLPKDSHQALADVDAIDSGKGTHYYLEYETFSLSFWRPEMDI
ncbi:autophagy-like protein 12, variant [Blastomyces dermatitidis ER-3]|uniref:Autophagy-like protein 12, variant n=1 Tax=Ajellomyces dermatitidis (strain ER-3 / ATCC MYA-2586) TaxID=559297 RepID=A0ABX2VU42_AJEDR|nr:autophagy-like protein 12, variant [Blastomyces dermatitidis ER-3]OAT00695.1 autophagy-like protein 12, variant [Blastomyces dermatitidis ER-3]